MKINRFTAIILLLLLLAGESSATYSVWGLRRLITEQTNDNSVPIPPVPSLDPRPNELKTSPSDGDKPTNDNPVTDDQETKASPTGGDKSTNDKEPKASPTDGDKSTKDRPVSDDNPIPNDKDPKASPTNGDKSTNDNPIPNDKGPKATPTNGDESTNDNPIPNDKNPKENPADGDKSTNDKEPKESPTDGDKSTNDNPIPNDKEPKSSPTDGDKSTNDKSVSKDKEATANPPGGDKSNEDKTKDDQVSNDPGKSNPKSSKESDNKPPVAGPPADLPEGSEKNDVKKEKSDGNVGTKSGSIESCERLTETCRLGKNLTACIQGLESGSKGLRLLIINKGESILKVNITLPNSQKNVVDEHVILGKQSEKIGISEAVEKSSKILLKAGDEECTLLVGPVTTQQKIFDQLPSYYKQITPIYIAYFVFLVALIIGGTCACCQLRKRKCQDGGVPYQELEMGISESASATNVETADGWDDGWDDDWDDDKAVKSPGQRAVGISANGLTARPSKQDGWGKEWDD